MLKVMLVSAAAIVGVAGLSGAATASSTVIVKKNRIAANGRCNGISYGTGARSCGTRTGGPVGGLSSRN